jgi:3-isopropylmalate/(R)-2-methylmalate dehydratase small subunit
MPEELTGRAHKFGDNINTDYIIPGKYKFKTINPQELAQHVMEGIREGFYKELNRGDFIVAGNNFGCGSSREQAPVAIKHAGITCVIAKSFARIFYRNSINIGLYLIEADTDKINDKDLLVLNLKENKIYNKTTNQVIEFKPLPKFIQDIIAHGGLVEYLKAHPSWV